MTCRHIRLIERDARNIRHFWLPLYGNRVALDQLHTALRAIDPDSAYFELDQYGEQLTADEVDLLERHSRIGDFSLNTKVTGFLQLPAAITNAAMASFETAYPLLRRGRITTYFHSMPANTEHYSISIGDCFADAKPAPNRRN